MIMVDSDGTLVFVEVKTRANEDFSPSESAVTKAKKTRMLRADQQHFLPVIPVLLHASFGVPPMKRLIFIMVSIQPCAKR